jgi:transposase
MRSRGRSPADTAQTAPLRLARRGRIIELAATGLSVPAIAAQVQQSERCVRQWLARFNQAGLDGLDDAPLVPSAHVR